MMRWMKWYLSRIFPTVVQSATREVPQSGSENSEINKTRQNLNLGSAFLLDCTFLRDTWIPVPSPTALQAIILWMFKLSPPHFTTSLREEAPDPHLYASPGNHLRRWNGQWVWERAKHSKQAAKLQSFSGTGKHRTAWTILWPISQTFHLSLTFGSGSYENLDTR